MDEITHPVEITIVEYLKTVEFDDLRGIHRVVYPGGFPVIGMNDTKNALLRLERRSIVQSNVVIVRGWFKTTYWRYRG